jgi:hypothetical protein
MNSNASTAMLKCNAATIRHATVHEEAVRSMELRPIGWATKPEGNATPVCRTSNKAEAGASDTKADIKIVDVTISSHPFWRIDANPAIDRAVTTNGCYHQIRGRPLACGAHRDSARSDTVLDRRIVNVMQKTYAIEASKMDVVKALAAVSTFYKKGARPECLARIPNCHIMQITNALHNVCGPVLQKIPRIIGPLQDGSVSPCPPHIDLTRIGYE